MGKSKRREPEITQVGLWKSVRKDWGDVDPRTTVKHSKKAYNRKKENSKWKKEVRDY